MKVTIRQQDPAAFRMINRPMSVAPDRLVEVFCDDMWEHGNLVYLMRGGYVYRCECKSDILSVN